MFCVEIKKVIKHDIKLTNMFSSVQMKKNYPLNFCKYKHQKYKVDLGRLRV